MKAFRLINVKMPTIIGSLTFMSRKFCVYGSLKLDGYDIFLIFLYYFYTNEHFKFHAQLS